MTDRAFHLRVLFFLLLFLNLPAAAKIQNLPFRRISPEGGFTLSPVVELAQDKQGFIWFITREKLYQYNSRDFFSFEPVYKAGISHTNNYITSMLIDRSNTIWVGTNAGLSRFNSNSWQMVGERLIDRESRDKVIFITDIKESDPGEKWVIESNLLARIDTSGMVLDYILAGDKRLVVNAFCFGAKDQIYAVNNAGELYSVNTHSMVATRLKADIVPSKIFAIHLINNMLWLSTDGSGLQRYTTDGKFVDSYFDHPNNADQYSNRIRDILKTSDGKIWIATYKGLLEWQEGNVNQYLMDYDNQFSLPDNSVNSLMEDRQKGLWIGTWRGGVGYLNSFANTFASYRHSHDGNSISGNLINAITEDPDGTIWIGTDGHGLDMFNEQRQIFRHIDLKGEKNTLVTNIKCIGHDPFGNTWIGTYNEGIFIRHAGESTFNYLMLGGKNIYDLANDGEGMWIATFGSGLYYYRYKDRTFKHFLSQPGNLNSLVSNNLKKLYLDTSGDLWIISSLGVSIKPKNSEKFEWLSLEKNSGNSQTQVYCISGSTSGAVWLGTDHGLCRIEHSRQFTTFPVYFNGMNVSVYGIVESETSLLWLSSNNGIFLYDTATGEQHNFDVSDGLPGKLFNAGAYYKTSNDKIYFGSTTGLVAFNARGMQINPYKPDVKFSRIFINHKEILPGQQNSPLDRPLYDLQKISLNAGQNSFSIEFIAQNYLNPQKNQFRYRLKDFDPNWIDSGLLSKATYTNIPPGEYVFEVVGCNNDMVWNAVPATLTIDIARPLWQSRTAILVYFLFLALLVFLARRIILFRARLFQQIELERLKRIEEEKLHRNKLSFFTNISHELRTPLTLISGPVESLIKNPSLDQDSFNQLSLVRRNVSRLLKLINQLLEFRRIEEDKSELNAVRADLVVFVHEIFNCFADNARQKSINYVFLSTEERLVLPFDAEKIDKAVFNLLSNAFKFVPEKGSIRVEIQVGKKMAQTRNEPDAVVIGSVRSEGYAQISVTDNGPGIEASMMERVFDRFFRIEDHRESPIGTGIGLHIAKHLILLHGGEIELESRPGAGSTFRIRLPYEFQAEAGLSSGDIPGAPLIAHPEDPDKEAADSGHPSMVENWNRPPRIKTLSERIILVVEDNHDLSNFISGILAKDYKVIQAYNGDEGIEKAQVYLPDLIISDIMMPGKSGMELVRDLKENLRTSHIPILLLTALTAVEHKVEGFSSGADDYIEKPFNSDVLLARIKNVFETRLKMQQHFARQIAAGPESEIPETPDQKLVAKAIRFVENNLHNEKLDIDQLADHLNLSQSTLYRKLKALTGKSATDFIRTIRLEYAARLLRGGMNNIEEVSSLAGFNSHSYFTRSFKEHFGKTPSEYHSMN